MASKDTRLRRLGPVPGVRRMPAGFVGDAKISRGGAEGLRSVRSFLLALLFAVVESGLVAG
jgi:hypothetical protein